MNCDNLPHVKLAINNIFYAATDSDSLSSIKLPPLRIAESLFLYIVGDKGLSPFFSHPYPLLYSKVTTHIQIVTTDSRIFKECNKETGDYQWFFESREGIMGAYDSEELVKLAIVRHIERCRRHRLDGGRSFAMARRLLSHRYTE